MAPSSHRARLVTFAYWNEQNQHLGICREEDLTEGTAERVTELATSPHALVGGPILDRDMLDRIACVRFGRSTTLNPSPMLADDELFYAISGDWDDVEGINPHWPRFDPPETPRRWTRTARSLAIS